MTSVTYRPWYRVPTLTRAGTRRGGEPADLAEPLGLHASPGKPAAGGRLRRRRDGEALPALGAAALQDEPPFFVLMRTRKPCVRRRRRRLGWNVRFHDLGSLSPEINGGETSMVANGRGALSILNAWNAVRKGALSPGERCATVAFPCDPVGSPPKFSTTVEKNVEKPAFSPLDSPLVL